ncbi:MAG: 7-carboxy-7-deazaguanine synthase QueE [Planctomycetes bacterium]|nr:7-carboxy-7-deazaguanine synthase QueE [Planctomycetota bacterium]
MEIGDIEYMVINEIFYSLQGEGQLAGVPSVFIRLAGCPLRCRWCDTPDAQSPSAGTKYAKAWLCEQINRYPAGHIVITGGEPMTQPKLPELLKAIRRPGVHITIETAGIMFVGGLPCELMSISPKLSNSTPAHATVHESIRLNVSVVKDLLKHYPCQLKFVVDSRGDLDEIVRFVGQLPKVRPESVFLMPQAAERKAYLDKSQWIADYCLNTGFSFGPRLQVMLWPGQRGK